MERAKRKKKILQAIKDSQGLLTLAAKKAGVTPWTVWDYSRRYPEVRQAVDEAKESIVDFAEGKLFQLIREGNTAAIIFFLKTRAKDRGYIERSEITGADGTPLLEVNVSSNETKEDINAVIARLSENKN